MIKLRTSYKLVIIFEILVILALGVGLFNSTEDVILTWDDFGLEDTSGTYVSSEMPLKSGAYTVEVCYDVLNPENNNACINDVLGKVDFETFTCPATLHSGSISLNSQDSVIEQTIWIDYGAKISDFKIRVTYNEDQDFQINSIHLSESWGYRVVRLVGFLILFAAMDATVFLLSDMTTKPVGRKNELLILLGIFVLSSVLVMSNVVYYGHDLNFHINRIASIANGLKEGQFPVRMHSDMLNGYGYPNSLFYGETLLYIPAVLYLLKVPLGACYQIYILLNNILTILFSYVCFKTITGRKKYALLGVFLYTLAPYRIINIYTRAAVGEYTAMTFLPLIILGIWNILTEEKITLRKYLPLCIGISGVVQSHVITTEMVIIFIALTCMICYKRVFRVKRLWALGKAAALTLLMNLWFVIPLLDSMSMDINSKLRTERIQEQGLYPVQWISMFFAGTGVSVKNTTQLEIGLPLGISFLVGILIAGYLCYVRKKEEQNSIDFHCMKIFLGLGCLAMILTSRFFPWDALAARSVLVEKLLCVIQYPWRYLVIASVCFSIVTVLAVKLFEEYSSRTIRGGAVFILVFLNIVSISYYYHDFSYNSDSFEILSEENRNIMHIGNKEYLLAGTDVQQLYSRKINTDENIHVEELEKENGKYLFKVKNDADCVKNITVPVLHYDNYRAYASNTGEVLEIESGENNCIAVEIPSGYEGNVIVEYHPRAIWRICEIVSAVTIILLIGYYACCDIKRRKLLNRCE